jgi:hypothetical protein
MKFADLHLHTVFSDGTYTPDGLILEAHRQNLSTIAVVDHDSVDGIDPTIEVAKTGGIELIPGIELTAECEGQEIHILGYLIDYKNPELREKLDFLKKNRLERIYKIAKKLNEIGVKLDVQGVFALAKFGTVGRLHIARAMVKQGLVGSAAGAFTKYIGDKCPAYVCGFRFSPLEAISLIKKVGGIAVLAHPYTLRNDELIPQFIDYGLMGLEVYYPEHTQGMINFYLNLAKSYNLLITGGSDCHGDAKPEVKIGSVKIPYDLVEKLKAAKEKVL